MGANNTGVGVDSPAPDEPPNPGSDGLKSLANRRARGYQSMGAMVYETLREAIFDGTLKPGQKLRQEVLAERIGVSRVPVRSALIQLEADGLVELRDRRGAVVRALTPAQVRQIYDLRHLLETHALRLSMSAMTDERIQRLRQLAKVVDAEQEGSGFIDARSEFYAELYDADSQPMLWGLIEQMRLKVGRYVLGWRLVGGTSHSHEELLDAVARGDVDGAVQGISKHLEQVRDGVLAKLEVDTD
jgi:DNA-binding GntR family transcriptional regulator